METINQQTLRFSNRELLVMLLPVIINDLTTLIVGMVDSVMVSSTGEAAVSGVSLVNSAIYVFDMLLSTLGVGCTVVIAHHIGANQLDKARLGARQSIYIGLTFAIPMFILLMIFGPSLLQLIYPDTDPAVMENARIYFLLIVPTLPFVGVQQMSIGIIRAIGKNRLILTLGIVRNLLNIAGNAILIYGFDMGIAGAAISSTLSCVICSVISFCLVRNKKLPVHIRGLLHPQWDLTEIKNMLSIGLGTGVERCLMMIGKVVVTSMYSSLSAAAIAAHSVSINLIGIGWSVIMSFGTILMTVVGQCLGAKLPQQAKLYTKKALYITIPLCFAMYGLIFLLRNELVQLYNFSEETLVLAGQYTGLGAVLSAFCLYPLAILPAYSFRAAGDTRYVMICSTAITFACQVGLCYIFVKQLHLGISGVWLSIGIDWIVRVICYCIHFKRGKWLTNQVI